jgi:hypothetical protein
VATERRCSSLCSGCCDRLARRRTNNTLLSSGPRQSQYSAHPQDGDVLAEVGLLCNSTTEVGLAGQSRNRSYDVADSVFGRMGVAGTHHSCLAANPCVIVPLSLPNCAIWTSDGPQVQRRFPAYALWIAGYDRVQILIAPVFTVELQPFFNSEGRPRLAKRYQQSLESRFETRENFEWHTGSELLWSF